MPQIRLDHSTSGHRIGDRRREGRFAYAKGGSPPRVPQRHLSPTELSEGAWTGGKSRVSESRRSSARKPTHPFSNHLHESRSTNSGQGNSWIHFIRHPVYKAEALQDLSIFSLKRNGSSYWCGLSDIHAQLGRSRLLILLIYDHALLALLLQRH
jgi:hypothetical protein